MCLLHLHAACSLNAVVLWMGRHLGVASLQGGRRRQGRLYQASAPQRSCKQLMKPCARASSAHCRKPAISPPYKPKPKHE